MLGVEVLVVDIDLLAPGLAAQVVLRQRRALVRALILRAHQHDAPVEALLAKRLGSLGAGASRLGLRFLLGDVLLGICLILLSLALADHVVTACHGADRFLGGEMKLDLSAAEAALEKKIAKPLGLGNVEAAEGILPPVPPRNTTF